jgi:hypothetical protein
MLKVFSSHPSLKELILFFLKTTFALSISFLFVVLGFKFIPNFAEKTQTRTFEITATAKREVKPDIVIINLGLFLEGDDPIILQKEASEILNKATSGIKDLGIEEENIKTQNFNLQNRGQYYFEDTKYDYYLSTNLKIEVDINGIDESNKNMVGSVLETAQSAGFNQVQGIYFDVSDKDQIIEDLKLEAIELAKAKKENYEKSSGIKLGEIVDITFGYYNDSPYPLFDNERSSIGIADDSANEIDNNFEISTGTEELSSTVTIYYEIK